MLENMNIREVVKLPNSQLHANKANVKDAMFGILVRC